MSSRRPLVAIALALSLAACAADEGGGSDGGGDDEGEGDDGGGLLEGYELLTETSWDLKPGDDLYYCVRKTIEEDMYIGAFSAMAPEGVHHILISAGNPIGPDGVVQCGSGDHNFTQMIFESSSGSDPFVLPEGLAAKVPAGSQINMNLHVLNPTDADISGTAGVQILPHEPVGPESLATIVHMGPIVLELPPHETTTVTGQCTLPSNVTAFGVLPHMHGLAIHQKVVAHSTVAGDIVLNDRDYSFDSTKKLFMVDPMVEIAQNDVVNVSCTYNNTTDNTVYWGQDSYTAEMCSGGVYVFPAGDLASVCAY